MSKENKYAININLFKIIGIYQLVNPKSLKILGFNIFQLINITIIIISTAVVVVGLTGFFFKINNSIDNSFEENMQLIFYIACITVGNLKLIIVIYNADEVWNLFCMINKSFLDCKYGKQNFYKLINCGKSFHRIFPWYFFMFFMTAVTWVSRPIILNNQNSIESSLINGTFHIAKVGNLKYPITEKTYNRNYIAIYLMECIIPIFSAYGLVTFDLFLIAILKIISTQYEIVASAYETLAYKYKDDSIKSINKKIFKDFLSITQDCQNIYKKLEIVYRITRPIVLLYMIGDALGLITMPYLIVMCYVQNGSSIYSSSLLTFLWTVLVVGIQSYLICSLFQLINEKKEAVNFGIYSCDWTLLDIKIKKLILLVMQINSSNNLKMNVTPTTFIDLPMFATIIRSSYSVTSVMINSNIHKL